MLQIGQDLINFLEDRLYFITRHKSLFEKIKFFTGFFISLIFLIHTASCIWITIGYALIDSKDGWIVVQEMEYSTAGDLYISSIYWAITTLSTVGYGDFKGYTTEEYLYTIAVEFIGIGFFGFIMGSLNKIILS